MKRKMILLLTLLAAMVNAQAGTNAVSVSAIDVAPGGTATVSIVLTNEDAFRGFQFDLALPTGISYVAESAVLTERASNQSLSFNEDNMRFMAVPNGSQNISGTSGVVMTLRVQAASTLTAGADPLQATLGNIRLSDGTGHETTPSDVTFNVNVVAPSCTVTVEDIDIEQGGTGTFEVALANNVDASIFKMTLTLPSGIEYVSYEKGSRLATSHSVDVNEGTLTFLVSSNSNATFQDNSGTILKITVRAAATLSVGTTHDVTVGSLEVSTPSTAEYRPAATTCTLTIVEPTYTELNENNTDAPEAASGVNVRVTRSLRANVWNTICLPFAMTADQVQAAFGEGTQLGDFTSWSVDDADEPTAITVGFSSVTSIDAHHPYIIKIAGDEDMGSFIVENVNILEEEEAKVTVKDANNKNGYFTGTYTNNTTVPAKSLFLNNNKFLYSTGETKSKAFRGYFKFFYTIADYNNNASARMYIVLDGEATAVETAKSQDVETGVYYNLQGVAVENPGKGLYIKDGKKVIMK